MNGIYKNLGLWLVIFLVMIFLFHLFNQTKSTHKDITYSQFRQDVDQGAIKSVTLQGNRIKGMYVDGSGNFKTLAPSDPDLIPTLMKHKVDVQVMPEDDNPWYLTAIISWLPMIFLIAIFVFFMRQMQAGGGKAMSFGKSRARLISESQNKITFQDVAGVEEAKEELKEIIDFLRDPKKFTRLGGKIPKGVLLMGGPGTGKTLLAKAVAGEASVPFFSISGSDFVEMFVGVGASRVRDLFIQGKKHAPCIIFVDEIDAVGRHRGAGLGGGHDEREQTLNQLLVEMDGFETNEGVILISATNRPDVLDPALLRPGRFDRQVVVPPPDVRGRTAILKVHTKKTPIATDVELETISRGTPGFSGADLANLVNEAALNAARRNKNQIEMADFEFAKDKVLMGGERRSLVISLEERRNTAFHEAGHAYVARMMPGTDPIHKVTIIPRGRALGVTQQLPLDDRHTYDRDYLLSQIAVLMGGRAAEEIFLEHMTTGAGNDIQRATELARKMVCEWGMSDALGPLTFGQKEEQIFLGKEFARHRDYSEHTAVQVDDEVRRIVTENYKIARKILEENKEVLERIAEALLERETLDANEIESLIQGKKLPDVTPPLQETKQDEERGRVQVSLDDGKVIVSGTPAAGPEKA
ncbi:ATP-dependent zinc metalloprotease FtsH [Desulfomonile tiedjei]|uniref:ATP-dependent zinc metalloprotease FtsH n=1 Tax=Desulfomonile tiedjei (strain ATCC 49306 / DSM 6799 / DCB-1) TaxID=706587 RepID=I4BZV1_DESTA|nr:ATP-dependent zinc metalloprotease FtsH [Desulfomonile tiedjei]AFM22842.1 membrane protease FtsH catalytic subunit [Desulfomonile tiedjei DSM 6799]